MSSTADEPLSVAIVAGDLVLAIVTPDGTETIEFQILDFHTDVTARSDLAKGAVAKPPHGAAARAASHQLQSQLQHHYGLHHHQQRQQQQQYQQQQYQQQQQQQQYQQGYRGGSHALPGAPGGSIVFERKVRAEVRARFALMRRPRDPATDVKADISAPERIAASALLFESFPLSADVAVRLPRFPGDDPDLSAALSAGHLDLGVTPAVLATATDFFVWARDSDLMAAPGVGADNTTTTTGGDTGGESGTGGENGATTGSGPAGSVDADRGPATQASTPAASGNAGRPGTRGGGSRAPGTDQSSLLLPIPPAIVDLIQTYPSVDFSLRVAGMTVRLTRDSTPSCKPSIAFVSILGAEAWGAVGGGAIAYGGGIDEIRAGLGAFLWVMME
jgi:hypothetical protein